MASSPRSWLLLDDNERLSQWHEQCRLASATVIRQPDTRWSPNPYAIRLLAEDPTTHNRGRKIQTILPYDKDTLEYTQETYTILWRWNHRLCTSCGDIMHYFKADKWWCWECVHAATNAGHDSIAITKQDDEDVPVASWNKEEDYDRGYF